MAPRAHASFLAALVCLPLSVSAAEPAPLVAPAPTSATWPLALDLHVLLGAEPHDRGSPVAFGFGGELLWRAWVGGFAELLAAEGAPVVPPAVNNSAQPSFADRISIPFGVALRPLAHLRAPEDWWTRVLGGVGVQLGPTVEYLRTSDASAAVGGLHAALGVEVPLWGGARQGGLALRLYGRMVFTPEVTLDGGKVFEPLFSGQIYGGVAFYP
jgi:hypothetical protein